VVVRLCGELIWVRCVGVVSLFGWWRGDVGYMLDVPSWI